MGSLCLSPSFVSQSYERRWLSGIFSFAPIYSMAPKRLLVRGFAKAVIPYAMLEYRPHKRPPTKTWVVLVQEMSVTVSLENLEQP